MRTCGTRSRGNELEAAMRKAAPFGAVVLALLSLLLSSCKSAGTTSVPAPSVSLSPRTQASEGIVAVDGPGWSDLGVGGPTRPVGSCHYRKAADGFTLPDPYCTPGAIDETVTQDSIDSTICMKGYSRSVRPPLSLTEPAKFESMREYGAGGSPSDYEYDHLIPLSLGGASVTQNLWPEPNEGSPAQFDPADPYGQNAKDGVEDFLHYAVCHRLVSLRAAQEAIATDWTTAIERVGLTR
jgi:hypothetical protein